MFCVRFLLGAEPHFRRGRLQRLGARLGDAQQYVALVLGEAAHRFDERRDQVMAVLQMDVDVAERRFAALIERDQTIVCCEGDISRHGNQQRQSRHAYENQRQQHRPLSLEIALKVSPTRLPIC